MSYRRAPIETLLDEIADDTVAPAGASAAAMVGAIGASLCEMAVIHTRTHGGGDAEPETMARLRESLATRRETLLDLADEDARIVESVFADSGAPTDTELTQATGIPLSIAETCVGVLEDGEAVMDLATASVAPDAHTGLYVTGGALRGAVRTVRTNLGYLETGPVRDDFETRVATVESDANPVLHRLDERGRDNSATQD